MAERKKLNAEKEEEIKKKTVILNETDAEMRKAELESDKVNSDVKNVEGELREARKRMEELEEECEYLRAKEDHLNRSIDMDEGIRQVKVEQLTNLMTSNMGLNTTITDLMGKWEQIIKFSREPPAPPS